MQLSLQTTTRSPLVLQAAFDMGNAASFTLDAEYRSLQEDLDTTQQPGTPGLPATDPRSFPKIPSHPNRSIITTIKSLNVWVAGVNYGSLATSFDLAYPISGATEGQLVLRNRRSSGLVLNPELNLELKFGAPITIQQLINGITLTRLVGFIVETPRYDLIDRNIEQLTLRVGDILALKRQDNSIVQKRLCADLPRRAGDAANLYLQRRGITATLPRAHKLEEVPTEYLELDPHSFLQELYDPVNLDIRTSPEGGLLAVPRALPGDFPDNFIPINWRNVQETQFDSSAQLPISRVIAGNTFKRNNGFEFQTETYETFSLGYSATDTRPWFARGSTRTVVTAVYLAGIQVYRREDLYGRVPLSTEVLVSAVNNDDPCDQSPPVLVGAEQLVSSRVERLFYSKHRRSDSFLINGSRTQKRGFGVYQATNIGGDRVYRFYDGVLEDTVEKIKNKALKDVRVCRRDWIHIKQQIEVSRYERVQLEPDAEPVLLLVEEKNTRYNRNLGVLIEEGERRPWRKRESSREYDTEQQFWTEQPIRETKQDPPQSDWIRPELVDVDLTLGVTDDALLARFGLREGKPITVPQAFSKEQLERFARRYLVEQAGDSFGFLLTLSPRFPVRLGDQVEFLRKDGTIVRGLVTSYELNQTGVLCTASILVQRWFI